MIFDAHLTSVALPLLLYITIVGTDFDMKHYKHGVHKHIPHI